ncbi:hypothetical protein MACK_001143 [Theileria orientalis]|uniref:Large ribosomal subunit protein bL12 C-terminal domain-containing protein n=1 Tax=Theileria orientalis TaxID=68886 RepID=A0A976ME31_THEOR|nr:hypothetical protein MACK_001143 [Theileria orientalis]
MESVKEENDVEYQLNQLIGSSDDSVPIIQVIGPYTCGKTETIKNYMKKRQYVYTYMDLSVYQHCSNGEILLGYEWKRFKSSILDSLNCKSKELRSFNMENGNKLIQFTKLLFKTLYMSKNSEVKAESEEEEVSESTTSTKRRRLSAGKSSMKPKKPTKDANKAKNNNKNINKNNNNNSNNNNGNNNNNKDDADSTDKNDEKSTELRNESRIFYVFDNFNDLINQNNKLLINILKIHEYLHLIDVDHTVMDKGEVTVYKGNKLVLILIGAYEVPINFQFNLPMPKVCMFPSKTRDELVDYIVKVTSINESFVKYVVQILFNYYHNDMKSMLLYINLLWNMYSSKYKVTDGEEDMEFGESWEERVLDRYLYNIISNYKTRYMSSITETEHSNMSHVYDSYGNRSYNTYNEYNAYNGNNNEYNAYSGSNSGYYSGIGNCKNMIGNMLCKIIILSGYLSSKYTFHSNTQYYKRYVEPNEKNVEKENVNKVKKSVRKVVNKEKKEIKKPKKSEDNVPKKGEFDLKYWLAVTQLMLIITNFKRTTNYEIYKHILWVVEEGYVHIINSNRTNLVIGKSGLLFTDYTTNLSNNSSKYNLNSLTLLNNNLKFCLNVPKEFISKIEKEIALDVHAITFDIFKKLQDSTTSTTDNDTNTRKPSSKVIKLVDEILNLTLIEAADLCSLCQEKLSENINMNANFIPGRHPFPHPNTFFQNVGYMPPGPMVPNSMGPTPNASNTQDSASSTTSGTSDGATNVNTATSKQDKKADAKKSIKLVGFDKEKKIEIIKTVRTLLNINLRESKELIESYPKVIKKNLDADEVERISKLIIDSGGQIEVE